MIKISKNLIAQPITIQLMKLTNYEEKIVTRHFEEIGKDIRFTLKDITSDEMFQKSYYLDTAGQSIDSGYIKPILKQTLSQYAEEGHIDFSQLIGKTFIVGIEDTFSQTTFQTYQNIVIFLPIDTKLIELIKSL